MVPYANDNVGAADISIDALMLANLEICQACLTATQGSCESGPIFGPVAQASSRRDMDEIVDC